MIPEGKDNPQNFADLHSCAHTHTLAHTQSPLGLWVLSSVSKGSSHDSALTAALKAPQTAVPPLSQSMVCHP